MNKNIKRRSFTEVQTILDDYRSSGLSIERYCSENDLNVGTFHWWLVREKKHTKRIQSSPSFIRLDSPSPSVKALSKVSFEIEYINGTRACIRSEFTLSQISQLLSSCALNS